MVWTCGGESERNPVPEEHHIVGEKIARQARAKLSYNLVEKCLLNIFFY